MKIAVLIARILLGIMFVVFGLNGFLQFLPMPPMAGSAGQFMGVLFGTHYAMFIFAVQLIGGLLLLSNQFVPLALTLLGPVIANILVFHVSMAPEGLAPGILALILWLIVFFGVRRAFAGIFAQKVEPVA